MEQRAFTLAEIAAMGGPKHSKAYELIASGELRAVKLGRWTRILAADYQIYLASLPAMEPKAASPPRERTHGQRDGQPRRRRRRFVKSK
jgi:excisionase family DNA binding protein